MATTVTFYEPMDTDDVYRHARWIQFEENGSQISTYLVPERVGYLEREDTRMWICSGHERVYDIAAVAYAGTFENPAGLWEAIAQFQPEPILDPSVTLPVGMEVFVPSVACIQEHFLGESLANVPVI